MVYIARKIIYWNGNAYTSYFRPIYGIFEQFFQNTRVGYEDAEIRGVGLIVGGFVTLDRVLIFETVHKKK